MILTWINIFGQVFEHPSCKVYKTNEHIISYEKTFNPGNILYFALGATSTKECKFNAETKVSAYWFMGEHADRHCEEPTDAEKKRGLWVDPKGVEVLSETSLKFYFSPLETYLSQDLVEVKSQNDVRFNSYVYVEIDPDCNFHTYIKADSKRIYTNNIFVKNKLFNVSDVKFYLEDELVLNLTR